MATEDFSFPTTTDTFSCSIDSPPLWCLSPSASPPCHDETSNECTENNDQEKEEEEKEEEGYYSECVAAEPNAKLTQRSFSSVDKSTKLTRRNYNVRGEDHDKEEKMDLLWEDFNEELFKISHKTSSRVDSERMVDMGCVHQTLRLSKGKGSVISPGRKPGLVSFMRVLKKLFLLHNSHRPGKSDSSHKPIRNR